MFWHIQRGWRRFSMNSFHLRRLLSLSCHKCRAPTQSLFSADRSKARPSPTAKTLPGPPQSKLSEHVKSTSPSHTVQVSILDSPILLFWHLKCSQFRPEAWLLLFIHPKQIYTKKVLNYSGHLVVVEFWRRCSFSCTAPLDIQDTCTRSIDHKQSMR